MIRTARLVLRPPEPADLPGLIALLSDPAVMGDLVIAPSAQTARTSIDRHSGYRADHGLGFWVVEHERALAGWCGLKPGAPGTPIVGELEIGWVIAQRFWGRGLAPEAARACLDWAWVNRDAARVVAITGADNLRSRHVMDRIGMVQLADGDFVHPAYPPGHRLGRSVTYAIVRPARG